MPNTIAVVKDPLLVRDTFLHVSPSLYRRLSSSIDGNGDGTDSNGMLVSLWPTDQGNGPKSALLTWTVPTILPGPNDVARSALLEPGKYLLLRVPREQLPPALARVELSVSSLSDYVVAQENANALIEWLFLSQVRLVRLHQPIRVWLNKDHSVDCAVDFGVERLMPEGVEYGMIGVDAELVILPPCPGKQGINESKSKDTVKRVRVRSLKCSNLDPIELMVCRLDTLLVLFPPNGGDEERDDRLTSVKVKLTTRKGDPSAPSNYSLTFHPSPWGAGGLHSGWLYVSDSLMRRHGWTQHQWIPISDIVPGECCKFPADEWNRLLSSPSCRGVPTFGQYSSIVGTLMDTVNRLHLPRGLILMGEEQVGKSHLLRTINDHSPIPLHLIDLSTINDDESLSLAISKGHAVAPCLFVLDHVETFILGNDHGGDVEDQGDDQMTLTLLDHIHFILEQLASSVLIVLGDNPAPVITNLILHSPLFIKTLNLNRPRADHRQALLSERERERERQDIQPVDIELAVEKTAGLLPRQVCNYSPGQVEEEISTLSPLLPSWAEIRGLDEVKIIMEETILWPLLYEDFYHANGFLPPSGVLLVGPTGVGKTLLARAFLNHLPSHVAILSVAGPSLLGKYVGSSERAVRDLFIRARAQRPALILLEELEALAPRRGSDATGTTDRVVNQLLTELDGAGERTGVHVLATSSRIDLIDPAILRPGRLETHIYLRPPGEDQRRQILTWLAPHLSEELVSRLAVASEGLSAAHLRSLVLQFPGEGDPAKLDILLGNMFATQASDDPSPLFPSLGKQRVTFA